MGDDLEALAARCRALSLDQGVKRWKEVKRGRAMGFLPVGIPEEILHAAGILPVRLDPTIVPSTGGDLLASSCPAICESIRSGILGSFRELDGVLFVEACEGMAGLSTLWASMFPLHRVETLRRPGERSVFADLRAEYERLRDRLADWVGRPIDGRDLRWSIGVYNRNRILEDELDRLRREHPRRLRSRIYYPILEAGRWLPCEEHSRILEQAMEAASGERSIVEEGVRVLVAGPPCGPAPLGLLQALEDSGCAVVGDDFHSGRRWVRGTIDTLRDPLAALANGYGEGGPLPEQERGAESLLLRARRAGARGVVVALPQRCPPLAGKVETIRSTLAGEGISCMVVAQPRPGCGYGALREMTEEFLAAAQRAG